jgi:hypothetical protein
MPETTCVHYWMVTAPAGASSYARCRTCGAEATFPNSPDGSGAWGTEQHQRNAALGRQRHIDIRVLLGTLSGP